MVAEATSTPDLIGIGLYAPSEASALLGVPAGKIARWLRGHTVGDTEYAALWQPQVHLEDGGLYLGFRDLMEVRVAAAFISHGVSAQKVRAAIDLARDLLGTERPLSTDRFRTDGRSIFLRVAAEGDGEEQLLNLFKKQYEFAAIIEPSLKGIDFDEAGAPTLWWPNGRRGQIVLDPQRSFGQPIDALTSVPTSILSKAGLRDGISGAAMAYGVPEASVRRSMAFEQQLKRAA